MFLFPSFFFLLALLFLFLSLFLFFALAAVFFFLSFQSLVVLEDVGRFAGLGLYGLRLLLQAAVVLASDEQGQQCVLGTILLNLLVVTSDGFLYEGSRSDFLQFADLEQGSFHISQLGGSSRDDQSP